MLSYFRINDPYRLIIIFFILILFRLPYLISPGWNTIPELSWMIVGERLNEGALLYVDVWDDIGPLSAWTYRILEFLFGRSHRAIQIFGLLVFFFHIFYVNYISLKHKMYNENNYLPALFYGILGLIFFNVVILSPQLLGLTFVLISMNYLFTHIETRNKIDGNLLNIGLFIGIASLFYLPYFLMIFVHIIGLIFFTNTIGRRYLLLFYGFGVPLIICWLIYVLYGEANALIANYFNMLIHPETKQYLSYFAISIVLGTTIVLFVIAFLKTLSGFGFTVFQVRIQKIMFLSAVVCSITFIVYTDKDGYGLVMFFPWIAFFLSHFFLSIKKSYKREVTFAIYSLSIIFFYFVFLFQAFDIQEYVNIDSLMINDNDNLEFADSTTLVLGPDISPYYVSRQATPYFNWDLSKKQLIHLDYYDNLVSINKNIKSDMPQYIIDQIGLAPKLFDKIPSIGKEYRQIEKGIYKRVKPDS